MPISVEEANRIFDKCDSNKDGNVTRLELFKGLADYFKKSMSVDDVTTMFNGLDEDGDNTITRKEFTNQLCTKLDRREAFLNAFNDMDKNKDGSLSRDEMLVVCRKCGYSDAEIDTMIKACDTNNDGKLSKEEFMALV